jgi:uncharacterized protein (DUF2345 family)
MEELLTAAKTLVAAAENVIATARRNLELTGGKETEATASARIRYTAALNRLRAAIDRAER